MNEPWTSKDVWNLLDEGGGQMVADAHNSAIAAANSQLDDAGSHNAAADRELRELRQQIDKHDAEVRKPTVKALEKLRKDIERGINRPSLIRQIDALSKVKQ